MKKSKERGILGMSNVTLRKHLEAYEATPEEWKKDHEDTMLCFDVQDSLTFGMLILDQMNKFDESFRLDAFAGKLTPDTCAEIFRDLEAIYHKWLAASLMHLRIMDTLHHKGISVEGSERFRNAVADVLSMMTPDQEFFSGTGINELRDTALDAHARGETTEWSPNN